MSWCNQSQPVIWLVAINHRKWYHCCFDHVSTKHWPIRWFVAIDQKHEPIRLLVTAVILRDGPITKPVASRGYIYLVIFCNIVRISRILIIDWISLFLRFLGLAFRRRHYGRRLPCRRSCGRSCWRSCGSSRSSRSWGTPFWLNAISKEKWEKLEMIKNKVQGQVFSRQCE